MARLDEAELLLAGSESWFERTVAPVVSEFRWFLGRIYNGAFESVDAELYYAVLRRHRPRTVIEVGSGNSAHFAHDALRANGAGRLVCIDPSPRRSLPKGVRHLAQRVEDVDPALFEELGENDVLFIDSSHTTAEARFHVTDLLPKLAPGVVVHHHDVVWPYARYFWNDPETYGEPDVLFDFYARERERFEVLGGAAWIRYRNPSLLGRLVKSYRWMPERVPGSVWTRARA